MDVYPHALKDRKAPALAAFFHHPGDIADLALRRILRFILVHASRDIFLRFQNGVLAYFLRQVMVHLPAPQQEHESTPGLSYE
jgi:hypothetical protein